MMSDFGLVSRPLASAADSREVARMFGRIAKRYDLLNHTLSAGIDFWWRSRLVRCLQPGATGRILDLAAGTMDVSIAIRKHFPQSRVLAMDISPPMLEYGLAKCAKRRITGIYASVCDGRALPLPDASVDGVTIAFGIRNIAPRSVAFAEMYRVLAPGGRVCVLEFGGDVPRIWRGLYSFYLHRVLPRIGRLISGDPAYITSHKQARSLIRRVERDDLIEELVSHYLKD